MRSFIVLIPLLVIGCQSRVTSPPAGEESPCPKVLEQSRAAGVDYVPTLRSAAKGDDAALSKLFQLTGSERLDAEAQQCHIEALAELLNRLGDLQFATALANGSPDIRRAVVNGLVIELENLQTAELSKSAFADQYPRTAATVSP